MKNVFVLKTDKPSRLAKSTKSGFNAAKKGEGLYESGRFGITTFNIYITNDEEIKEGDWFLCLDNRKCNDSIYKANEVWLNMEEKQPSYCKKVILTTDQDLIKDGVQSIDDKFLEWFVKNPSCEEVEVDKAEHGMYKDDVYYKLSNKIFYKIIIQKEEQTKCYCGHTTTCDCGPEEPKQEKSYREEEVIWALLLCSNKKFKNSLEVKEWWNNFKSK